MDPCYYILLLVVVHSFGGAARSWMDPAEPDGCDCGRPAGRDLNSRLIRTVTVEAVGHALARLTHSK